MFKKVCAVFLMLLVRVYDAQAANPRPAFMCASGAGCGWPSLPTYDVSNRGCASFCLSKSSAYKYGSIGTFSQVSGEGATKLFCACYTTAPTVYENCDCTGKCDETGGVGRTGGTYKSDGTVTISCKLCPQKVCAGVYEEYSTGGMLFARRKSQFCSADNGLCMEHSNYYDVACAAGYYGEAKMMVDKTVSPSPGSGNYPTCTKCTAVDGVLPQSVPGENETKYSCLLNSGTYSGTTGSFSVSSVCYPEKS